MHSSKVSDSVKPMSNISEMKKEDMYAKYMENELRHKKMLKDN
jgi:hypothetical protein